MAKKKAENGVAVAPPERPVEAPREEPPVREAPPKERPVVRYKLRIGTTTLEVTVVEHRVPSQVDQSEVSVYSVSVGRTYFAEGTEKQGGGFRTAELAGLLYLIQKASDWVYSVRTEDSALPF